MKTLFISREVEKDGELSSFCAAHQIQLVAEPMIRFEQVVAADFPYTDVIFFTSPRSVTFFLHQGHILPGQQLATIGVKTTEALQNQGYSVGFTGATPTQPKLVAHAFRQWLDGRTVLFPQSSRSNRTMQQELDINQYVNRVVYKTVSIQKEIRPTPDILIFSSPSNAEAFLLSNTLTTHQKVIAFGTTTAAFLKQRGVSCDVLNGINEEDLVAALSLD